MNNQSLQTCQQGVGPAAKRDHDTTCSVAWEQREIDGLICELETLHAQLVELETEGMAQAMDIHVSYQRSARNLLHYLALRRHDIRRLQDRLAALGLSALGRSESHVKAMVETILEVLRRLRHPGVRIFQRHEQALGFKEGQSLLMQHTEALLGPEPSHRHVRIMVTMPSEAADDPALIQALLEGGMDCARINCAHDDVHVWGRIIAHVRSAERVLGRQCTILMDLAGPKLRTGPVESGARVLKWKPRRDEYGRVTAPARVWLYAQDREGDSPPEADGCLPVPRDWLTTLGVGDRIDFVDARGARRFLWVVHTATEGCWAEAVRTAYVAPGTELYIGSRAAPWQRIGCAITHVGNLSSMEQALTLRTGDKLILTKELLPGRPATYGNSKELLAPARIGCTLPEIFQDAKPGERIWLDDGKIGGKIESVEAGEIQIQIIHARARGEKLRADKGINLPQQHASPPASDSKRHRRLAIRGCSCGPSRLLLRACRRGRL